MNTTTNPRISLTLMLLIVVPWTIVLSAGIAVVTLPAVPEAQEEDLIEIEALRYALRRYRQRYGEYPPDFTTGNPRQEIQDHLQRIFPARDVVEDLPPGVDSLGPDQALAFWLRGFCHSNSRFPLTGQVSFGIHPETGDEILFNASDTIIEAEVYDADETELMTSEPILGRLPRIVTEDRELRWTARRLIPQLGELGRRDAIQSLASARRMGAFQYRLRCSEVPLVYFRGDHYAHASFKGKANWGIAVPYQAVTDTGTDFIEPAGFQLICAGTDAYFGSAPAAFINARQSGHVDNLVSGLTHPVGTRPLLARHREARWLLRLSPLVAILFACAYPVCLVLRDRGNHLALLGTLIQQQSNQVQLSQAWRGRLQAQHARHRVEALHRLRQDRHQRPPLENA